MKKQKSIGAKNRTRGNNYERKIVKELKELSNDQEITTTRNESKKLDNMKIDISDPNNIFPCYFQLKATQNTPSVKQLNNEVGKKDKPLCILWAAQELREKNQITVGEYAIIPKNLFYNMLKKYINE